MNAYILTLIVSHEGHPTQVVLATWLGYQFFFNHFPNLHTQKFFKKMKVKKLPMPGFEPGSAAYHTDGLPMYHLTQFSHLF